MKVYIISMIKQMINQMHLNNLLQKWINYLYRIPDYRMLLINKVKKSINKRRLLVNNNKMLTNAIKLFNKVSNNRKKFRNLMML